MDFFICSFRRCNCNFIINLYTIICNTAFYLNLCFSWRFTKIKGCIYISLQSQLYFISISDVVITKSEKSVDNSTGASSISDITDIGLLLVSNAFAGVSKSVNPVEIVIEPFARAVISAELIVNVTTLSETVCPLMVLWSSCWNL